MKKLQVFIAFVVVLAAAHPMYAQGGPGGCISSPENPTALLAVVGSAGAFIATSRNRFRRNNK